jgi:hypothetical protein
MKICAECIFFTKSQNLHEGDLPEGKSGFCHRYPPTVFLKDDEYRSLFPPVRGEFACGEHRTERPYRLRRQGVRL